MALPQTVSSISFFLLHWVFSHYEVCPSSSHSCCPSPSQGRCASHTHFCEILVLTLWPTTQMNSFVFYWGFCWYWFVNRPIYFFLSKLGATGYSFTSGSPGWSLLCRGGWHGIYTCSSCCRFRRGTPVCYHFFSVSEVLVGFPRSLHRVGDLPSGPLASCQKLSVYLLRGMGFCSCCINVVC